ncbi:MAG: ATP-binding protein [Acidobacteriota bacterium]
MMAVPARPAAPCDFYPDSLAHLADELRRLDLLLRRHIGTLRSRQPVAPGMMASKGVYITHQEVDALLEQDSADDAAPDLAASASQDVAIADRVAASAQRGIFLSLPWLARLFALSPLEVRTLVICLAPELRRKYDTLYAYIQDDVTRKPPSVDLVLDVLCPLEGDRWRARAAVFADDAPLFRHGILRKLDDPRSPSGSSGLAHFLQLDQRILHYLVEGDEVDGRLASYATLLHPASALEQVVVDPVVKSRLSRLCQRWLSQVPTGRQSCAVYLQGARGTGRLDLAMGLCGQCGRRLLHVDMQLVLGRELDPATVIRTALREGLLWDAAIYVDECDALLQEDLKSRGWLKTLARVASEYGQLIFLSGGLPWPRHGAFDSDVSVAVELPIPEVALRRTAWEHALRRVPSSEPSWAGELASQFRLTPGQIHDAAAAVVKHQVMAGEEAAVTRADLYAACRQQSHHKLAELAVRIEPHYHWDDLVLPGRQLDQIKELCGQVVNRQRVYDDWGFARKLTYGRGISALFAGPSGTGKTMAAEVVAGELQLDLYKIDLSGVVNKYIGETEKNLARIFHEAEASNAILFFDEADALFGKRTRVSDAHDRYANIETSYLLQRMEAYEGIVILATNLRENMDDAFTRRIRFIVDFPFPDAASRKLIWQTHFPREAPVSADLDYDWLADQLQITGGNIRNIVLNAAFCAAAADGAVEMTHVLHGTRREFEKIGKSWVDSSVAQGH